MTTRTAGQQHVEARPVLATVYESLLTVEQIVTHGQAND